MRVVGVIQKIMQEIQDKLPGITKTNIPSLQTNIFCLFQSLGVCMCSASWAGSDCSVPRDSNSLIWETLLDTQLTLVRPEHNYTVEIF